MMRKAGLAAVVLGLSVVSGCMGADASTTSVASRSGEGDGERDRRLFEFDGMGGVTSTLTGINGAIRGVNGAGAPWVITRGKGELRSDGTLEIDARGVVFDPSDDRNIAAGRANANTVPLMRGILSCITVLPGGAAPTEVNLMTDPFPATTGLVSEGGGNVHIEQRLSVPDPCFAPVVFVTNNALVPGWFAVTGARR